MALTIERNTTALNDQPLWLTTPVRAHNQSLARKEEKLSSMVLLDLMGGVALLPWGLHMVHSDIVRAFGSDLRGFLRTALRNRFLAFLAGLGVTALLQSSTTTG